MLLYVFEIMDVQRGLQKVEGGMGAPLRPQARGAPYRSSPPGQGGGGAGSTAAPQGQGQSVSVVRLCPRAPRTGDSLRFRVTIGGVFGHPTGHVARCPAVQGRLLSC